MAATDRPQRGHIINSQKVWWASAPSLDELNTLILNVLNSDIMPPPIDGGHKHRFAVWHDGSTDILKKAYDNWLLTNRIVCNEAPSIAFLCSGQGSQFVGMAANLWELWPWFRDGMQELFSSVEPVNGFYLSEIMLGKTVSDDLLSQTIYTQPIIYALEVMLIKIWQRWGVKPNAVMGHSLGEFAAAYAAGAISDIQGMQLVAERGRTMQTLHVDGKYVVVKGEFADVVEMVAPFSETVSVAGANAPDLTVVSGPSEYIDRILVACERLGMKFQTLPVSLPFHSPLMRPILDEFEKYCDTQKFNRITVPWVSTMTGAPIDEKTPINGDYWKRQIVEPVRFWVCMENLADIEERIFLEIGPGQSLIHMGQHALSEPMKHTWVSSLDRKYDDREALLRAAVTLWAKGLDVDLHQAITDYSA